MYAGKNLSFLSFTALHRWVSSSIAVSEYPVGAVFQKQWKIPRLFHFHISISLYMETVSAVYRFLSPCAPEGHGSIRGAYPRMMPLHLGEAPAIADCRSALHIGSGLSGMRKRLHSYLLRKLSAGSVIAPGIRGRNLDLLNASAHNFDLKSMDMSVKISNAI